MAASAVKAPRTDNRATRSRTQSENWNVKPENWRETNSTVDKQRKQSTQSDSVLGARNKSSSSTSSTQDDDYDIDIENRLSIQDGENKNRKGSSGSNSDNKFDTQDDSKYRGMVKEHYISTGLRSHCLQCNRKFSVKFRPHHCRRCGEIHCMKCLRYRRKLNRLANFDPSGKQRKVCRNCFNEETVTIGCTRRLTEEFCKERQLCRHERILKQRTFSLTTTFWRDQLDMEKECTRLLDGFSAAVGTSEAKRTLRELQEVVKPPKWQQSSFWQFEKQAENCRACKGGLGIRKKKRNCKVCGLALCKKCSNRELLLYIEKDKNGENRNQTKLVIIKVVGSPEKEPDISLLLHVCTECKEHLIKHQTTTVTPSSCMKSLIEMDRQFTELHSRISSEISQCEKMVDSVEAGDNTNPGYENLSEYLLEVDNNLDVYEKLFHSLRSLGKTAETRMQQNLFKHYTMARYEFYMENRHVYRRLKNRNEEEQRNTAVLNRKINNIESDKRNHQVLGDEKKTKSKDTNVDEMKANTNVEKETETGADEQNVSLFDSDIDVDSEKKSIQGSFMKRRFSNNKPKSASQKNVNANEVIFSEAISQAVAAFESGQVFEEDKSICNSTDAELRSPKPLEFKTEKSDILDHKQALENNVTKDDNSEADIVVENARTSGEVFVTGEIVSWKK